MTAEQSLLGAILIKGGEALQGARGIISAEDFSSGDNRAAYEAACQLYDDGEAVDPVTVLRRAGENGAHLSASLMRDLMLAPMSWANWRIYAEELALDSIRRRLHSASETAGLRLMSGESVQEVALWLRNEAAELFERMAHGGLVTSTDALLDFSEYRQSLESGTLPAVVASGYEKLDELLGGGFALEGLYILAGRPGTGKTTLAVNIADRVAAAGVPTLFVSLEMSLRQLTAKRLAVETGISSTRLLNNTNASIDQWQRIYSASPKLSGHPLSFNRAKSASVGDIEKLAAQIPGLGLVIIDYLGLLRQSEGRSLYEKVTATSGALKGLARQLGIPVLCLAQLNREVEGRAAGEPRMSDLRDSGALEQDADGIILLHQYKPDESNKWAPVLLEVVLAKNRHGEVGKFCLDFYLSTGRMR